MNKEKLQAISSLAHSINVANGFNEAENTKRSIALIVSELSEMLEADRKNKWSRNIISDLALRESNALGGMSIEQAHRYIVQSEDFLWWFKETAKDTVEDELADVVIRITSFLAALGKDIDAEFEECPSFVNDAKSDIQQQSIPENIFDLMKYTVQAQIVDDAFDSDVMSMVLIGVAYLCFDLAEKLGIDLEWHIDAKLRYNKTRPYLHGKSY